MAIWTAVHGITNGENVDESVLNRPSMELRERTDYLYNLISALSSENPFEAVKVGNLYLISDEDKRPELGDIVYLNPDTQQLEKACASLSLFDNIFTTSDLQALALGILTNIVGGLGTVALFGKVALGGVEGAWATSRLVQSGETFRPGPYYLSTVEAGKLTARPRGPAIYIGQFLSQTANPLVLDYALLAPQYKDLATAHTHESVVLTAQPAGHHIAIPGSTHTVVGYRPQSAEDAYDGKHTGGTGTVLEDSNASFPAGNNLVGLTLTNITKNESAIITANTATTITADPLSWDHDDEYSISERNRLVVLGNWADTRSVQYTFTLAGLDIINPPIGGPSGFEAVYLHWTSTDPLEPKGVVQVRSYETPIAIGTKGLKVVLEPTTDDMKRVEEGATGRRKWVLDVPNQTRGWLTNKRRTYFRESFIGTNLQYSLMLFGGPHERADKRELDTLHIRVGHLYRLIYGNNLPIAGDTITIGETTFEFSEGATENSTTVPILMDDVEGTYIALMDTINAAGLVGTHAIIDKGRGHLVISTLGHIAVSASFTSQLDFTELLAPGVWGVDGVGTLIAYDSNNESILSEDSCWINPKFWEPVKLVNNLSMMLSPYSQRGLPNVGMTLTIGDSWSCDIVDEAPGANFVYPVGMHDGLNIAYPPNPKTAGVLVLNGLEMENSAIFKNNAVYTFGNEGIYWYSDQFGYVPWPRDWLYIDSPTTYIQHLVYHSTRSAIPNSSIVTSLKPASGSPIVIRKCGTQEEGNTGDLELDLDLQLSEAASDMEGYEVYKAIFDGRLAKGPVVSQIEAGPGISIASPVGVPHGRGRVRIGLSEGLGASGEFEAIALENAKQEMIGLYPYIKLPGYTLSKGYSISSGFTAKFKVPIGMTENYKVLIYLTMFGEEDTQSEHSVGLEFTYSILHDYMSPVGLNPITNLLDDLITPVEPRRIVVPMGQRAYDPIIVHNNPYEAIDEPGRIIGVLGDPLPVPYYDMQHSTGLDPSNAYVTAGSLFAMRIRRVSSDTSAEYTGGVGFINLHWKLV